MRHYFYDTLHLAENECPATCNVCEQKCEGIKIIHLPEVGFHTPVVCNQCREPVCEEHCPTGAIRKDPDDGVVRINQNKCLGCGLCSLMCPYGGISYNPESRKTAKCDLCDGQPECVDICPYGVLTLLRSRNVMQYLNTDVFEKGSPLCLGCPAELSLRFTMRVLGKDTFLFGAPGCAVLMICGMGMQTYCHVPAHMTNMTNLPSTAAGLKRYYKKAGQDVKCVCFAGDGCFSDVGFQPLSGAAERNENIIVICYDNEGFMNTGIQRSGTSSYLSWTTTTPVGTKKRGKQMPAKNLPFIMAAHEIPYVATATIGYPEDYAQKLTKAKEVKDGLSYIHLLSPCPTGWRTSTGSVIDLCQLAVETNYFPLWEYKDGHYTITQKIKRPKPIKDYLKLMGKFKHLDTEEIDQIQHIVDQRFTKLKSFTAIQDHI